MTSPRAASPALTTEAAAQPGAAAARIAARHRAETSALRRWTRVVLVIGTVVSLACALGPLWLVRLGLIPALGAALVSCLLAWRELGLERRAHAAAMLAAAQRHGAQLTEERRHNAAVVDMLSRRLRAADTVAGSRAATIARLRGEMDRLQGDVNGLRGANGRLTRDLNFRDVMIRELRSAAEHLPQEADAAVEDTGEIHAFPRRPLREVPDVETSERRTADVLASHVVMSLPNYEGDRRFG